MPKRSFIPLPFLTSSVIRVWRRIGWKQKNQHCNLEPELLALTEESTEHSCYGAEEDKSGSLEKPVGKVAFKKELLGEVEFLYFPYPSFSLYSHLPRTEMFMMK